MLNNLLEIISVFVLNTIEAWGITGVFVLSALESANIPIPSEVIIPFAGFLAAIGRFNFWAVVFAGAFGNLAGSLVSYYTAAKLDKHLRKNRDFIAAQRWFERFGVWSVFFGRMFPVIRTFISFPAGMFKVNIWKFSYLTFLGSFLWSWLLAYVGFFLGERWDIIGPYFRQFDFAIFGILILAFGWWAWHHFGKRNKEVGSRNYGNETKV